jgi:hypothetical protein
MKSAILLVALLALGAQQSNEAYPGQSNHAEPPAGWMCHRPPVDLSGDQSHWCSCERSCDPETQVVHTDKRCATYCWEKKSCACGMSNEKRCMGEAPEK